MAKIEDLINEISDPALREQIAKEVKELKETKRFGLVFEEHIPETVSLYGLPIRPGLVVQNRTTPDDLTEFQVIRVEDSRAIVVPKGADSPETTIDVKDLLVVKRFHERIFPGLTPVGEVRRGLADKPAHVVINGENFHALQLLAYTCGGKVDCIYIDPPYNTGDKSWKYNNRFVDANDSYRHSKWLSFMEKRLKLARSLLKDTGSIVVTIDEHEVHRLGVLMNQVFPEMEQQTITIMNNPKGVSKDGYNRVNEHAIVGLRPGSKVSDLPVDFMRDIELTDAPPANPWVNMLRRGSGRKPSDRPNMCFPIAVDPSTLKVVGVGKSLKVRMEEGLVDQTSLDTYEPPRDEKVNGHPVLWPRARDGSLGRWGVGGPTVLREAELGYLRVSSFDPDAQRGVINRLPSKSQKMIDAGLLVVEGRDDRGAVLLAAKEDVMKAPQRMWVRASHDAGTYGSDLLTSFLGYSRSFTYPKSLYSTLDTIRTLTAHLPNALIVDFFAGSGTTAHSVALLNAMDGGNRQCVLVTNNELDPEEAAQAIAAGAFPGDDEYEKRGIFESATKPRLEAAMTGRRPSGEAVVGTYHPYYAPDRAYAAGLEENIEFFRLDYLDPDLVELGRQFNAIVPMLWMAAGSIGEWEEWDGVSPWSLSEGSTYGVLFDEEDIVDFAKAVQAHPSATHVWLVTNSHTAFTEMRQALPDDLVEVRQLYRDYLRNFTVNAPGVLRR